MKQENRNSIKIVCQNRKARHDYFLSDIIEAGLVLTGTEVKSLRLVKANLRDSYCKVKDGEIYLINAHISPYSHAYYGNHDPLRERKLLLHKREIKRLVGKVQERGFSLIPTKIYLKNGKAKVEIALAKGKRKYDKRETIRKRDEAREMARDYRKKDSLR
ncbi:MAG: SsrA-binding protein SmpB [Pseudomonadota bacterium]